MNSSRILSAFQIYGPATVDEIERATGLAHQVVSARSADFRRRGQLRHTGKYRPTRYGRPARVMEVIK